jgi:hypothetical protein
MDSLGIPLFERLVQPGPRLPWLKDYLLNELWSLRRFQNRNPADYLITGEKEISFLELLIAASADRIYCELLSPSDPNKKLIHLLENPETAVVIFDGLSLREAPLIQLLAAKSGFKLMELDTSLAAAPSETLDFIERELGCGRIAPSQLPNRKDLKEKNIVMIYHGNYNQPISGEYKNQSLLVWSSFPDETYRDSGAKFERHFENILAFFETAWLNIIQQIKDKKKILITSDHGYIYFGTGLDFPRTSSEIAEINQFFGNDRHVYLSEKPMPPMSDDIYIDPSQKVAMIKGRVKTRSTGTAASKLYKHGGLSLMEMITPWIELEI